MQKFDSTVLTVTALNQTARTSLEANLGVVWVEGEISNFTRATSGHLYLTLKDDKAQVRAAFFKHSMRGTMPAFKNGMQVRVRAKVSIYEARGDYQLIIDHMEEAGLGALQRAFELLKAKLAHEGLFLPEHKKPIPSFVQTLGIITSPTGAALQDILHTLERRYPLMHVIVYPTLVQGKEASAQVAQAIKRANQHGLAQLLIVARGGGSLEDLFAFNEENVARAIFASRIPIISGVGHETDVTIADFVADMRAATPTAAAELASPDQEALKHRVMVLTQKLTRSMENTVQQSFQRLQLLNKSLVHPSDILLRMMQRVDFLSEQLVNRFLHALNALNAKTVHLANRLAHCHPNITLDTYVVRVDHLRARLSSAMNNVLIRKTQLLGGIGRELQALSPLDVLDRGYSITLCADGKALQSVEQVRTGDVLETRVIDGVVRSVTI